MKWVIQPPAILAVVMAVVGGMAASLPLLSLLIALEQRKVAQVLRWQTWMKLGSLIWPSLDLAMKQSHGLMQWMEDCQSLSFLSLSFSV